MSFQDFMLLFLDALSTMRFANFSRPMFDLNRRKKRRVKAMGGSMWQRENRLHPLFGVPRGRGPRASGVRRPGRASEWGARREGLVRMVRSDHRPPFAKNAKDGASPDWLCRRKAGPAPC